MTTETDLDWANCPAVEQDPQRVSGAWVFRGSRIPVAALFENLEDDVSLEEFVELFLASVSRRPGWFGSMSPGARLRRWSECGSCSIRGHPFPCAGLWMATP